MDPKKVMARLQKLEGAVLERRNPHAHVIRTKSPSFNFIYGKGHGMPRGYSTALFGPPKGGKTLLTYTMMGQTHTDYPDSIVVKFDAEFRDEGQLTTPEQAQQWGLDMDRYMLYQVNSPDMIFDRIETEIAALCQDGANIPLVIVDSVNGIQGRRTMNADSVMQQQIGDHALTIQDGLKRILPIQRKYGIGIVFTCQARAEMDKVEVDRGNKIKMGASFGLKHHCEYFVFVEQNLYKAGRQDLLGNDLRDEALGDVTEKGA